MITEIKQKEFCRLTGLTRKALLVYEDKGILLPHRIDSDTGYRYYNSENVYLGNKIAFLRSLSFSVQDIQSLISESPESARLLAEKAITLHQELLHISHGIHFIELNSGHTLPFSDDLREISIPLQIVATIEGRGDSRDIAIAHRLLNRQITVDGAITNGDPLTYYFDDSSESELHFKAVVPITATPYSITGNYLVEYFGTPRITFLRHYGSYELLPQRYSDLVREMKRHSIAVSGEYFEIYRNYQNTSRNSDTTTLITDIGVPQWL